MKFLTSILIFSIVQSVHVTHGIEKLIRVNEWQEIIIGGSSYDDDIALVDFHLFATCEKFSVLFMTEKDESTRFAFSFYDLVLKKVDIESVSGPVDIPKTPKLLGTCREKNRKILRVKIRTSNESMTFKIDDQLVKRPFDAATERIKVLIPQSVACCLIRALFLSHNDMKAYSSASTGYENNVVSKSTVKPTDLFKKTFLESILEAVTSSTTNYPKTLSITTSPSTILTTTSTPAPLNDTNKWSKYTLGKNPTVVSSTTKPETSWTHAVNKQWSITFVLCSIVICTIMLFLAVFGTFTVFYLMTKPSGGKSPFSVDA